MFHSPTNDAAPQFVHKLNFLNEYDCVFSVLRTVQSLSSSTYMYKVEDMLNSEKQYSQPHPYPIADSPLISFPVNDILFLFLDLNLSDFYTLTQTKLLETVPFTAVHTHNAFMWE